MPNGLTVGEIAAHVGGTVRGDALRVITGVSTPAAAGLDDLVFIESAKHTGLLRDSRAGAALASHTIEVPDRIAVINVPSPTLAMSLAIDLLCPPQRTFTDVSPAAVLGKNVRLGLNVGVGPNV